MTLIESIILGLVQGLSEFLPISSSGHLPFCSTFGIEGERPAFAVLLYLGTRSLVAVYYRVIWELIIELFATVKDLVTKGLQINKNETRNLAMIVVATIPTGLMGVFFNDFFAGLYNWSCHRFLPDYYRLLPLVGRKNGTKEKTSGR